MKKIARKGGENVGRWIENENKGPHGELRFDCSECHEESISEYLCDFSAFLTPYCPWCGAEMENWVEEQDRAYGHDYEAYDEYTKKLNKKLAEYGLGGADDEDGEDE